jgi:hypothetical protein
MLRNMNAALAMVVVAREPEAPWAASPFASHAPPDVELPPLTREELQERYEAGEVDADDCERVLVFASRMRAVIDVGIARGLHALCQGDRLAQLGYWLDDYAREVLDVAETTTRNLVQLGAELPRRPLLDAALQSGRLRIRAAETILPVARGDAEARWVQRAAEVTVRQLEQEVRRARKGLPEPEKDWLRLRTQLPPEDREVFELGLEVAAHVLPSASTPLDRLEAMTMEFVGAFSHDVENDETRPLGSCFRRIGPGEAARREALEKELDRWPALPVLPPPAWLDVRFDATATAQEIDACLRKLSKLRAGWDALIGWCAHVIRRSGLHRRFGFASFRHAACPELVEGWKSGSAFRRARWSSASGSRSGSGSRRRSARRSGRRSRTRSFGCSPC